MWKIPGIRSKKKRWVVHIELLVYHFGYQRDISVCPEMGNKIPWKIPEDGH